MSSASNNPNQNNFSAATSSPPKQEPANPNQKLSPEMVDLTVAELRYQTAFYLEAVQAMMDGVTLGSEQVQDKRIEFLETGPSTDPSTAIILFVMTLVLEGTVGPAVAALAVRAVMRPMMRAMAKKATTKIRSDARFLASDIRLYREDADIYRTIGSSTFAGPSSKGRELINKAVALEQEAEKLLQDFRGKPGAARSVREVLEQVTSQTQENLVPAFKAGTAVYSMSGSGKGLLPSNSPSVAVLAAAMVSASKLRLTVVATHEALEAEMKSSGISIGQVSQILSDYRIEASIDLAQIRESFQLATEAMIWAHIIIDDNQFTAITYRKKLNETDAKNFYSPLPNNLMLPKKYDKLAQYLIKRFEKEIERWVKETGEKATRESTNPDRSEGFYKNLVTDELKIDLLIRYLAMIKKTTSELKIIPTPNKDQ